MALVVQYPSGMYREARPKISLKLGDGNENETKMLWLLVWGEDILKISKCSNISDHINNFRNVNLGN